VIQESQPHVYGPAITGEKTMGYRKIIKRFTAALLPLVLLVGCATSNPLYKSMTALPVPADRSLVLLPMNITVMQSNLLSSSEVLVDKTAEAYEILSTGIIEMLFEAGVEYIPYGSDKIKDDHLLVVKQSEVLLDAAYSKEASEGKLYAISRDAVESLNEYGAGYVLTIEYTLTVPSGGQAATSLLLGVGDMNTYLDYELALYDLRDGQLAWSNRTGNVNIGMQNGTSEGFTRLVRANLTGMMAELPLL
jgi:hypothetical protein